MVKKNINSTSNSAELTLISENPVQAKEKSSSRKFLGIGSLSSDAITGVTDIVELVHKNAFSFSRFFGDPKEVRTKGLTGLVYKNIRSITGAIGSGVDILIEQLSSEGEVKDSSSSQSVALAVLNGIIGDHLLSRKNPLAIEMCFRRNGLPLDETALAEQIIQAKGKIAIMIHGSCMNDLQWKRNNHDHGAALERDLDLVPIYLYYNTGRHISENGRELSELLETLKHLSDIPLELVIVAHSMGGLVARSACHYAKESDYLWLKHLRKIVCLGTPHHGTHLEKAGNLVDVILETNLYSAPFSRLGKIRSSGVTDLRFGNVVDDDWSGQDRFKLSSDKRKPIPLPESVECYAIAAVAGKSPNLLNDGLVGDGLVTVNSALGRHKKPEFNLSFPADHQWMGRNMGHLSLLDHADVYTTIKAWLKA